MDDLSIGGGPQIFDHQFNSLSHALRYMSGIL
jgi:hypothetical protein